MHYSQVIVMGRPHNVHERRPGQSSVRLAPGVWLLLVCGALLTATHLAATPGLADGDQNADSGAAKITGVAGAGFARLDQIMLETLKEKRIPGASLAISKDGRLVLARGYGLANVETNEPVRPTSLFNLASCTKPFTAVAILKLADQGKLKLDDRVFRLLADVVPASGAPIDPRIPDREHPAPRAPLAGDQGGDRGHVPVAGGRFFLPVPLTPAFFNSE
jgi:hypothetical protein